MSLGWEIGANTLNAVSILLAGRNSVHTWWTGIAGCTLFGWVFFNSQLYADATLQGFFIITSAFGWYHWLHGRASRELPIRHMPPKGFVAIIVAGIAAAGGYGWLLYHFTDAFAPFIDSAVLAFSVVAQFLLMGRRIETWWCWLLVNTIAVPLFVSRGLFITAVLYAVFWVNAFVALRHWNRLRSRT